MALCSSLKASLPPMFQENHKVFQDSGQLWSPVPAFASVDMHQVTRCKDETVPYTNTLYSISPLSHFPISPQIIKIIKVLKTTQRKDMGNNDFIKEYPFISIIVLHTNDMVFISFKNY